jgi:hypothetical protein
VDTESEVQEVESTGLASRMITRRNLIKGGAIVGGTVWVAPAIESFTSRAFGASARRTCCQCFSATGAPRAAAEDDFSSSTCVTFCEGNTGTAGGSWVLFVAGAKSSGFSSEDDQGPQPGCTYKTGAVYLGGDTSCPSPLTLPSGVTCFSGSLP